MRLFEIVEEIAAHQLLLYHWTDDIALADIMHANALLGRTPTWLGADQLSGRVATAWGQPAGTGWCRRIDWECKFLINTPIILSFELFINHCEVFRPYLPTRPVAAQ